MHEERLKILKENWFTKDRWKKFKEPRDIDSAIKMHEARLEILKKAKEQGCKQINKTYS